MDIFDALENAFPFLADEGYEITSSESGRYNCIAWSSENDSLVWWPDSMGQLYWPDSVPREETVNAFLVLYSGMGYLPCQDGRSEEGFQKIAIYTDENGKPTHAARQLSNGRWTSKLGPQVDIEHSSTKALEGAQYGKATCFLKKSASN